MTHEPRLTRKDVEARSKAMEILKSKFIALVDEVMAGRAPTLVIRKRTLTNTIYDEVNGLLRLGNETLKRSFLNVGESKKFMQTLLIASIIYEALKNNEYPTIRDLYYRGKHTIKYRDLVTRKVKEENTWEEQKESDAVIRDLEVFIDMLREDMLILSKEKGKIVGNMRIRSGDDVIDLSKMGHGAYSIEPTPDLIEFLDYDAEYVLVVEKDAVFQQLHRIGYWKTNRALLVTSAGQPDRASRRFVRRLNEELKLPVYILTDSIPADEVVVVRDPMNMEVKIGPVEELTKNYFSDLEMERSEAPLEVLSWSPATGRITWSPIAYIYRHAVKEPILRIETKGRGVIRVTKAHSLFVFRNDKVEVIPAKDVKPGDFIIVAKRLPTPTRSDNPVIVMAELLRRSVQRLPKRFKLLNTLKLLLVNGREVGLEEASDEDLYSAESLNLSRSRCPIPNRVEVDEDLAWLMGLYTAEGGREGDRCLTFNLDLRQREIAERVAEILKKKFGGQVKVSVDEMKDRLKVVVASRILRVIFEELRLIGTARDKRVPNIILNSPRSVVLAYLKGLIDGGGYVDESGNIVYSTRSPILARQVFLLLQFLHVNPELVQSRADHVISISRSSHLTPPEVYKYLSGEESALHCELLTEQIHGLPASEAPEKELTKSTIEGLTSYSLDGGTIYNPLLGDDAAVVKVETVREESYEGYVYDFAVPGGNSFIGGFGVVYHNSDPYGWYIYSVFKVGSITLSYESERLATPQARFLGVMMSDIYGSLELGKKPYLTESERRNYIIKAKDMDVKRARELMNYKWFRMPRWKAEIEIFMNTRSKLEIEALTSKGLRFLAEKYLPDKVEAGDWIA